MNAASRKAAVRQYKERDPNRGVFALRFANSRQVWVGQATDLDAARNRLRFELRLGGHRDRALQEEWSVRGEAAFGFDVLEKLDPDTSHFHVKDLLSEKARAWTTRLAARILIP